MKNAILYYDPQFMNEYENIIAKSKIDFECCKALKCIGEFYLNRHFSSENYVERSGRGTGLNAELCSYIVNIIMEDYQKLQLNFIIDSLSAGTAESLRSKRICLRQLICQKAHFTVL